MTSHTARLSSLLWIAAVLLGTLYWCGAMGRSGLAFEAFADWPKHWVIALKGAATGALVAAVWLCATSTAKRLLALSLSVIWTADIVLALGQIILSGFIFVGAQLLAMAAYWRARSAQKAAPQFLLMAAAIVVFGMGGFIWAAQDLGITPMMLLFPIFSLLSAALALLSHFRFWPLAAGTIIFSLSDSLGVLSLSAPDGLDFRWLVWTTYFGGLAMISWSLVHHPGAAQPPHTGRDGTARL